jgi:hypothetical protein
MILYLRPFPHAIKPPPTLREQLGVWLFGSWSSAEGQVVSAFKGIDSVVTVQSRGEIVPLFSAHRVVLGEREWKGEVHRLMVEASLVVIEVADSENLMWEISTAFSMLNPEKFLFAFGGLGTRLRPKRRQYRWEMFKLVLQTYISRPLPETVGDACVLYFGPNWEPRLISRSVFAPIECDRLAPAIRRLRRRFIAIMLTRILVGMFFTAIVLMIAFMAILITDTW